ncbi:MAG: TonB-dependent receptor [Bacteroides sp.]|nr:TonB-dependent receptor [Bacteroides sp.]MCM1389633.1 TonB-dependent receptor [Bacteroides sp.]
MFFEKLARRAFATLLMGSVCLASFAQTRQITGTVVDTTDEPLTGANVIEVGTANGVSTDIDGNFTLQVKPGAELKITYIGYQSKVMKVGEESNYTIVLAEDNQLLDEVVVVGYGTMKKSDLTGAMGSMSGEKLQARGTVRVEDALQGAVPGLNITSSNSRANGGFSMQIRGQSSINKSTTPLYVVDGLVVSSIDYLNPSDIERIDVLKDASSTAIYGSRASNGVIVVTTKGGGAAAGKSMPVEVSYDGYYGFRKASRMPDFMDSRQFMDYRLAKYTILDPTYGVGGVGADGSVKYYLTPGNLASAYFTGGDFENSVLRQRYMDNENYDWTGSVLRTGHQQNHFVSASGSTEKTTYRLGLGYQSEENVFKNNDYWRVNLKGAFDSKLSKVVEAGMSVNLAHDVVNDWITETSANFSPYNNAFWFPTILSPYNEDGSLAPIPGKVGNFSFSSMPNPLIDFEINPYDNSTRKFHVFGNAYLRLNIADGLRFTTTLSPNYYHGRQGIWMATGVSDKYPLGSSWYQNKKYNQASSINTERLDWTWDNQIDWNKKWNKHSLNMMGLFSMHRSNKETYTQTVQNVADDKLKWWAMNKGASNATLASTYTESSIMSFAARANYNYDDRYMLTATIRTDGSSRFAKDHRWGWFPSAAFAWRASQEEFLRDVQWLDNLKFRISYGITGNNNVGDYVTNSTAAGPNYTIIGGVEHMGYYPNGLIDQALVWEKIKEFDFGVDFGIFNNRLNVSADVYRKDSDGQIMDATVPIESGETKITTNIGSIRNTGIELGVNIGVIRTRDFDWNVSVNFARNWSKITSLPNGDDISKAWFLGERLNVLYGYSDAGVITDKGVTMNTINGKKHYTLQEVVEKYGKGSPSNLNWYEGQWAVNDWNDDGVIDANDRHVIGCTDPTWTGSLTSSMSWKGWDFSFMLYTKQGQMSRSYFHEQYFDLSDRGRQKLMFDYYIPAGTPIMDPSTGQIVTSVDTHYGKFPYPNNTDKTYGGYFGKGSDAVKYHDTSFVKVKNITLGYTFPKKWMDKVYVKDLRLYVNVLNPFCWTKYKGFDPEWAGANLTNGGPSSVTYQFGMNLKF